MTARALVPKNDQIVQRVEAARRLLAEAKDIPSAKQVVDLAYAAKVYARRRGLGEEAVAYANAIVFDAERLLGQFLKEVPKNSGAKGIGKSAVPRGNHTPATLADLGLTKKASSRAQFVAELPDEEFQKVKAGVVSVPSAVREKKRKVTRERLETIAAKEAAAPTGLFDVLVIDPPWPMEKIERDERPNQSEFDYPTMTEDELRALALPAADDCHVWLWTTQRFLPMAFRLLDAWSLRYVCTFVWHKPGGFQPVGLPQFNCEFALYARRGSPMLLDTKALPTCFDASRGAHSEKPEQFYDTVRRVTAGRRLDMFNRRSIKGFVGYGKEAR
jgi:N6-adenosine-specific RNA methylase IME4